MRPYTNEDKSAWELTIRTSENVWTVIKINAVSDLITLGGWEMTKVNESTQGLVAKQGEFTPWQLIIILL